MRKLGYDTVYMCIECDDSSFSRFRDIIGAQKFKMGHSTVTATLLMVICRPYAKTSHSLAGYKI